MALLNSTAISRTAGVAKEREVEGDLFLHDMGQGMPFRAGTFDGAVSISAVQWLCNEDKSWHNAQRRITCFFQSLYSCLARGAKAIIQLYPETPQQMELITSCAMRCGFTGVLVRVWWADLLHAPVLAGFASLFERSTLWTSCMNPHVSILFMDCELQAAS